MERRLVAILAADVVGYSRLMEVDEERAHSVFCACRSVIEGLIAKHGGRIFGGAGDSVMVEFASPVEALRAAVEIQNDLAERRLDLPDDQVMQFRMGINLGDVMVDGGQLFGDGVNVAARLQGLAEPGGICISGSVHEHVGNKLPLSFDDLGACEVKNIAKPVHVFRVRLRESVPTFQIAALRPLSKPSIAVLPFTNMSDDLERQYFSDGITEDIITELSRYRSLLVIARNSAFQFRGSTIDIVRRKLGVQFVVEGSIRKIGGRLRVTAQLIDAMTERQVWAERYDHNLHDIFALQDEIARTVATTLEGRVAASGAERSRRKPTGDWVAYDYFLQGRALVNRYQMFEADPFFARAIELDPGYAHAHAWRALALTATYLTANYLFEKRPETIQQALACAQRALALDDNDAWSHQAMGYAALRQNQLDLAGVHFERAISLNPNDVNIVCDRANWLMYVGRLDEALRSLDLAMRRDPYPPTWLWEVRGLTLFHLKRYQEAVAALRSMSAQHAFTPALLAAAYAQADQLDEAHQQIAVFRTAMPNASLSDPIMADVYADEKLRNHWLDGLRRAVCRNDRSRYHPFRCCPVLAQYI